MRIEPIEFNEREARVAMEVLGASQTQIARQFGVTPQTVYKVLTRQKNSQRINRHFKEIIKRANRVVNLRPLNVQQGGQRRQAS
jgi:transposase-like protein